MPETDDIRLLREFTERQSDAAFGALVTRYVNLVYSVALRQTGNPHAAEEITQAVFIILARKAASFDPKTVLSGWLYQTARLTAANYRRTEFRRARREQEAHMQSVLNEPEPDVWPRIAPLLDDALGRLGEKDRHAIVLRFFENKSLGEIGAALGASEDAAKMRVNRALEKLRKSFTKRGVALTTALIAGAVSANSVQAAPVGLAVTVVEAAANGSTLAAPIVAIVKGTMKMMTWMKLKSAFSIGTTVLLVGGAVAIGLSKDKADNEAAKSPANRRDLSLNQENQASIAAGGPSNVTDIPVGANDLDLSPTNILMKVRRAYASLSTYRDSGWTVFEYNEDAWTNTSTVLLGGRNRYRIEVVTAPRPFSQTNRYWSDGLDNYHQSVTATITHGLDLAGNVSSTVHDTVVPTLFYNLSWGNVLIPLTLGPMSGLARQKDEKIGDVDCYVLNRSNAVGSTNGVREVTLWIGKEDFLVRRWRDSTSAWHSGKDRRVTKTVTRGNVFVNETFSSEDFVPTFPTR